MTAWPPGPAGGRPAPLAEFNGQSAAAACRVLLECCSSARWAEAVLAGRPYRSVDGLLRRSDEAVAALAPGDLGAALAGHPRIGERSAGPGPRRGPADGPAARAAAGEQAGVAAAGAAVLRALAEGNRAYERRFGHIYLVCATGRSAGELLALLTARLENDPDTEWGVVRSELQKINRIRLAKLLGGCA
jgi:2-oxo-4-hydroxy-4-carboxy-5-ureidoimidazoline decarboxylase